MKDRKERLVGCCSWDFFHIISLHDVIIVMLESLWKVLWTCGRISVCSRSTHIVGSGDFNRVPFFVSSIGKMSVINIVDTADTNVHWHSAGFDSSQLTKYPLDIEWKKELSAWSASQKLFNYPTIYKCVCVSSLGSLNFYLEKPIHILTIFLCSNIPDWHRYHAPLYRSSGGAATPVKCVCGKLLILCERRRDEMQKDERMAHFQDFCFDAHRQK